MIPDRKPDVDPKERSLWGDLMSMGLVFPLAIVLGFFLGRWIGGYFGKPQLGQWIGLGWGILTGFYELYKVSQRMAILDEPGDTPPKDTGPGKENGKENDPYEDPYDR